MIGMQRTSRCSINLKCNQDGLDILIAALEFIAEKREVEVEFDRRIINRKTTKFESRMMIFMLDSNPDRFGEICDVDGQLVWIFNTEDYEYAVDAFGRCKEEGCFNPAEFLDIRQKNIQDCIYCELSDEIDREI
ncbi:MAG: hypothetical protein K6G20_08345 [Ruminococcus sp.]|nr:hypothetical protein [Ruminococcus sp.]